MKGNPEEPVHTSSHPPLRIETEHDDRVVLLGCDACATSVRLLTTDTSFADEVQRFFERHARCPSHLTCE